MTRRFLAVGCALLALATLAVPAAATHPETTLLWGDEFNGAAGLPPWSGRWGREIGTVRNAELQCYTDSTDNARLTGGGKLEIVARYQPGYQCRQPDGSYTTTNYTSASVTSRGATWHTMRYGRIQVMAALPYGPGVFPAAWMLGNSWPGVPWPRSGEIDIVENPGDDPYRVWYNLHGEANGNHWHLGNLGAHSYTMAQPVTAYHRYDLHWTPDRFEWWVDGALKRTVLKSEVPSWPFDDPFFVILNLAVGGTWPSQYGQPDPATFPRSMLVEHVRVYGCSC